MARNGELYRTVSNLAPAELAAFLAVVEYGGFRAAARVVGSSPSALSHSVAGLEARLKVQLFIRTTRNVSLLADMLMEAGQPAAALAEYEKSFQRDPNRFRGLYGAGRAAEAAGDQTKALDYANRLIKLTGTGDTIRPE